MAIGDTIFVLLNQSVAGYGQQGWTIEIVEDAKAAALIANGDMTVVSGPATHTPPAYKIPLSEIPDLSGVYLRSLGSTSTSGFEVTDPDDGSTEWNFYRAAGATAFTVNGKAGFPADITLFAPNGTDYADFTFDGNNTEIDASVGNISLRPLSGGDVNIWATSGTPKLRVGSANMAQSMDFSHDGTNGIVSTTIGDLDLSPASALVNLTNVGAYTSASAGGASALPAAPQGYIGIKVQGTTVKIPYYLP